MTSVILPARALLFDLDGVLIDSSAVVLDHWRSFAGWYDLDPERLLEKVHGTRAHDVVAAALPHASPRQRLAAEQRHAELELADTAGIVALPGAADLLATLDGAAWAIVTAGTTPVAVARIRAAGLPVPDVLVAADDVSAGKPDPEGYLRAAGRLAVPPRSTVVIEDAPVGVAAGIAAGAKVLGLCTTHPAGDLAGAHVVVDDLTAARVHRHPNELLLRLTVG